MLRPRKDIAQIFDPSADFRNAPLLPELLDCVEHLIELEATAVTRATTRETRRTLGELKHP